MVREGSKDLFAARETTCDCANTVGCFAVSSTYRHRSYRGPLHFPRSIASSYFALIKQLVFGRCARAKEDRARTTRFTGPIGKVKL